jgi:hypothetical protein
VLRLEAQQAVFQSASTSAYPYVDPASTMAGMDASPGRILVLGASGVGKHTVLGLIRERETVRQGETGHPWHLDTKYYTADVHLEVRHVDQCADLQLDESGYEALLLVFNAGQESSFHAVQRWYVAANGGEAELGVKLAVCTRADTPATGRPSWLAAAEEWCTEQLVEFVETGAAEPTAAAAEQALAERSGEGATGVHRIREALAAHMWPGMQLKPSPRHGSIEAASAREQEEDAVEEDAVEAAAAEAAATTAGNGVHPSSASASSSPGAGEEFSFEEYLRAREEAAAVAAAGGSRLARAGQEEEGAEDAEQLEQLFLQLSSEWWDCVAGGWVGGRAAGRWGNVVCCLPRKPRSITSSTCPRLPRCLSPLQASGTGWGSCPTRSGGRRQLPW